MAKKPYDAKIPYAGRFGRSATKKAATTAKTPEVGRKRNYLGPNRPDVRADIFRVVAGTAADIHRVFDVEYHADGLEQRRGGAAPGNRGQIGLEELFRDEINFTSARTIGVVGMLTKVRHEGKGGESGSLKSRPPFGFGKVQLELNSSSAEDFCEVTRDVNRRYCVPVRIWRQWQIISTISGGTACGSSYPSFSGTAFLCAVEGSGKLSRQSLVELPADQVIGCFLVLRSCADQVIRRFLVLRSCAQLKAVANCLDNLWWNCLRIKLSVVFWYCVPVRIKLFVVFWYCVPVRIKLSVVFWQWQIVSTISGGTACGSSYRLFSGTAFLCGSSYSSFSGTAFLCGSSYPSFSGTAFLCAVEGSGKLSRQSLVELPADQVIGCFLVLRSCADQVIRRFLVLRSCAQLKAVANCLDNLWWNCLRIKLSVVFWYCVPVRIKLFVVFWYCVPLKAVANCLDNLWRSCLRIKLSVVFWYCILERSPRRVVGRKAHELSCGNETLLRVTPEGPESIEISESNWTTNREIGNIRPLEADKVQQISRPEAWLKFDRLADFGSAARLDMLKRNYLGYLKTLCLVETIDSWRTILAIHSQQTSIDLKTLRSVEKILHAAQKPICRLFGGFDRLFCRTAEHAPARSYIRSFYPRIVAFTPKDSYLHSAEMLAATRPKRQPNPNSACVSELTETAKKPYDAKIPYAGRFGRSATKKAATTAKTPKVGRKRNYLGPNRPYIVAYGPICWD
ncbi:hypothetical protein C8F04DRAFT_1197197 [Mycena alexandri]|uniref:Uncharacterized protein n=1 Tax=Mycena alexandri TaxID=1745969 RepID=A0AAD6WT36_9AGAR|nr:hypothetical protein C8F04DRAFT_1197197 [Mycena alexandri]